MVAHRKSGLPLILSTVVGEDRRLVINLPPDAPTGLVEVELIVRPSQVTENSALTAAREKLRAAGRLSTGGYVPEASLEMSDEALWELGNLPSDAPPSEQLVSEDRGDY